MPAGRPRAAWGRGRQWRGGRGRARGRVVSFTAAPPGRCRAAAGPVNGPSAAVGEGLHPSFSLGCRSLHAGPRRCVPPPAAAAGTRGGLAAGSLHLFIFFKARSQEGRGSPLASSRSGGGSPPPPPPSRRPSRGWLPVSYK